MRDFTEPVQAPVEVEYARRQIGPRRPRQEMKPVTLRKRQPFPRLDRIGRNAFETEVTETVSGSGAPHDARPIRRAVPAGGVVGTACDGLDNLGNENFDLNVDEE